MSQTTNATPSGQAYLGLQRNARLAGRTTAEYIRLYALEGFLLRLQHSSYRNRLVLKGGVLLAAYELRRPTSDVDVAALRVSNDVDTVRDLVATIAGTQLPEGVPDDGLSFDIDGITAQQIRDEDEYSGVRVRVVATLATAKQPFNVDVNVGDPIWPEPTAIELPRLLDGDAIEILGYPMEMVLAEKIVTALQRGAASTRWRDFADIFLLTGRFAFGAGQLRQSVEAVAAFRRVELTDLEDAFDGYADIGQAKWIAWRNKVQLDQELPETFGDVLTAVRTFADPVLTVLAGSVTWSPTPRAWDQ